MPRFLRSKTGVMGVAAAAALGLSACGTAYGSSTPTTRQPAVVHTFLSTLGHISTIGSAVPANGDVNPYGIAVVSASAGRLVRGNVLVSNFNDAANVQGTGRTIVELSPSGKLTLFAKIGSLPTGQRCPGGIGLGTALAVLPGGWVVVGSIPAAGPSGAPSKLNPNGCLIVLNSTGKVVETWSSPKINGPWDMTASVHGSSAALFVSNALSRPAGLKGLPATGTCDVTRINVKLGSGIPRLTSATVIGSGFAWKVNHPTFVLSPTGLAITASGTLYVVETIGNHITAIPNALTRTTAIKDRSSTLTSGGALSAPLGLLAAPNGDLIAVNGNNGKAVEISPQGHQVATATLVPNGAGALFGLALSVSGRGLVFVNDGKNTVESDTARAAAAGTRSTVGSVTINGLGPVLAGESGRTLYYLSTESRSSIQCTGACTSTWRPYLVTQGVTPTSAASVVGKVSTTARPDGRTQATFNGHPVYFFAGDSARGQATGQGVSGTWFVLQTSKSASAPSRSKYGY